MQERTEWVDVWGWEPRVNPHKRMEEGADCILVESTETLTN